MDDDTLIEQLRSDADRLDTDGADGTDVGALVRGALRQGHRRRTRRRALGAGLTGLVAAGLVVVAASVGLPGLRDSTGVPAATPTAAVTSVPSSPSPSPSPSTSTPRPTTGRVSGSPAAVQRTLTGLVPRPLQVTGGSAAREEGADGFPWENNAVLTVRDDQGSTQVLGGIGNGAFHDDCSGAGKCELTTLPDGGTLRTVSGPPGDKTGVDRSWYYTRPDGGHVWLMERNYVGGNDPVTRKGLLLSWDEGTAIVTDPAWDPLFRG